MKHTVLPVGILASLMLVVCAAFGERRAFGDEKAPPVAEPPLHEAIDALLLAKAGDLPRAPRSTDPEFLRRVYLDLAGRIPTRDEARAFLQDSSDTKREKLIEQLLSGPDYSRRMQEWFHAILMERRGEHDEWTKFLRHAFVENMPWDQLARSIIHPQADTESVRGAAYFFTARLVSEGAMAPVDIPSLTRDVGRLFVGVDLGCAQCHDDLTINDYKQVDFQGLHMIFENVKPRRDVPFPAVSENVLTAQKEFMSVFVQEPRKTPPRAPGGGEIPIVTFPKGEEYAVEPDRKKRTPGIPKFSPLAELATRMTSSENPLFRRNIVNRLWSLMMGRGFVEPLDVQHTGNPPTHPELLDRMADEFASHDFDIRWLLREIALTDAYQRSGRLADGDASPHPEESYTVAVEKRISAEQLFWSVLIASGEWDRLQRSADQLESSTAPAPSDESAPDGGKKQEATPPQDGRQAKGDDRSLEGLVAGSEPHRDLKASFLKAFANPPKEPEVDFRPTVKGAFFLMHDPKVLELCQPKEGNLVDRLSKLTDEKQLADELFMSVLSRPAGGEDRADVTAHLEGLAGDARIEAIGQLAWALLTSTEFHVNH